ncbi:site-specific DNA-methyltransferase, partial [bacterium]|nr:site-specific DNA-methyltransferase [bacterium]
VLSWPYKDCVLEGGMTKDDRKRDEIFWNETLAPDEISRLLDPKVFTNAKRIDKKGKHKLDKFKTDENGNIKDNLIIKGNNLLALHFLKKRFAGKIKLIYIDPPFNTEGAANTFNYNNSFNHSTWLLFMKNRLEVARNLLQDNGIIVVSIDAAELFYLGVLMDELFNRENRMGLIAVVHNPGGRQDDKFFPTAHENMIFFARNISKANLNRLGLTKEKMSQFKYTDKYGQYKLRGFRRSGSNSRRKDRPNLYFPIYYNPTNGEISINPKAKSDSFIEIFPIDEEGVERCWRWGPQTLLEKYEKYIEIKKVNDKYQLYVKERASDYEGEKAKTIWDKSKYTGQTGTHELKNLFDNKVFSYPKSPYLMKDVVKITTQEGDIILDFFAGSGTTGAVAHKMRRQYILVEQMEDQVMIIMERLKKVINSDQGGISKEVGWKGGGDFVYLELMKWNENFVEKIRKAKTKQELKKLWEMIKKKAFLSYKVDVKVVDENAKDFADLSINDQKKFLLECLDKNHLYVNYSEIEDEEYGVSKEDKKLNKDFYGF